MPFTRAGRCWCPGSAPGCSTSLFEGNYADHVVNATHYEVTHRATGSHADGAGTIEAVDNGPRLVLEGNWRELRWPLAARFTAQTPQIFSSPQGQLSARGRLALRAQRAAISTCRSSIR